MNHGLLGGIVAYSFGPLVFQASCFDPRLLVAFGGPGVQALRLRPCLESQVAEDNRPLYPQVAHG